MASEGEDDLKYEEEEEEEQQQNVDDQAGDDYEDDDEDWQLMPRALPVPEVLSLFISRYARKDLTFLLLGRLSRRRAREWKTTSTYNRRRVSPLGALGSKEVRTSERS